MAEFTNQDLTGSRFDQVDLTGARFRNVDLTGAVICARRTPTVTARPGR